MLPNEIRLQLSRLQLHPVNLNVSDNDDELVALEGSLLRYWVLPSRLDGRWLLAQLQDLPDAAGPEVVMNSICAAHGKQSRTPEAAETRSQLRLFDSQDNAPAARLGVRNEE